MALQLPIDPLRVVEINNEYRRADVGPDDDLWTLAQVREIQPRAYTFPVPTVVKTWPTPQPKTQEEYSEAFAAENPEIASIGYMPNVVIAGGAAAQPLGERGSKAGDVDFFIHGIDPADEGALWGKAAELVNKIVHDFSADAADSGTKIITQVLSPGAITLTAHACADTNRRSRITSSRKIQVILRAYPNVSAILHAFDIPAACIAYDGRKTYLTTLGAYAHVYRVNIVVPAYRSTTYESRLIKYAERGYALALPHLNTDLLRRNEMFELPHLRIMPRVVRTNFIAGDLGLPIGADSVDSDYGPRVNLRHWDVIDAVLYNPVHSNIRALADGSRRLVVMGGVHLSKEPHMRDEVFPIPFLDFVETGGPKLSAVLDRARFEKQLDSYIRCVVDGKGRISLGRLRHVFGLNDAELFKLSIAVAAVQAKHPGRRLDLTAALAPYREKLVQKYEAMPDVIEWWIRDDPGRQYTASREPRIEDPAVWYGKGYCDKPKDLAGDELTQILLGKLEAAQVAPAAAPVYENANCPLCQGSIERGAANSLILACGHMFHWSMSSDGCPGLFEWISTGHHDCPYCRQPFRGADVDPEQIGRERQRARIVVPVNW